ncbi:MAG TPA: class I SAM-dependent methyltransferase [Streptosporangiaceae bacterium]
MSQDSAAAVAATDPYAVTPGWYDLFRAAEGADALPSVAFFAGLAPSGGSALEIGPGTGRITLAVAERTAALWCLERSPTMRAVLLAKLAGRPDLWDRVTVLQGSAPTFRLSRRFDYIYLAGVLEHIPARDRPALFAAIAEHLIPGGTVAMDMVLTLPAPDEPEHEVSQVRLGECRYVYSLQAQRIGPDLSRLRMTYRTLHHDELIATDVVTRLHNMHRPGPVQADLAAAGLVPVTAPGTAAAASVIIDAGVVVARTEVAG